MYVQYMYMYIHVCKTMYKNVTYDFIFPGPESPPRDVLVTGTTSTSVVISWLSPELPNGVITLYKVYITYVDCPGNTSSTEFVNNANSFVILGLSPYQMVQVQVSASTSVGEGPRSDLVTGRSIESGLKYILY